MIRYFIYWFSLFCVVSTVYYHRPLSGPRYPFPYVNRTQWGASRPTGAARLRLPVPYVHTYYVYAPYNCTLRSNCIQSMKVMQNLHQKINGWDDIAYNFAIGGDNVVYEGRGWRTVGAHASGFNSNSISIALLVNENQRTPTENQKEVAKKLINYGIRGRYIKPYYSLAGHQLYDFEPNIPTPKKSPVLNMAMNILGNIHI